LGSSGASSPLTHNAAVVLRGRRRRRRMRRVRRRVEGTRGVRDSSVPTHWTYH